MKYMLIEVAERAIGVPKFLILTKMRIRKCVNILQRYAVCRLAKLKLICRRIMVRMRSLIMMQISMVERHGRSSMARITTGRFSRFVVMFAELFMRIKREIMLEEIKFYEVSVIFPNLNLWYTMTVKSNYIP